LTIENLGFMNIKKFDKINLFPAIYIAELLYIRLKNCKPLEIDENER